MLCCKETVSAEQDLLREIRRYAWAYRITPALQKLLDEILTLFGPSVRAVLYYGSCLQTGRETDGLLDLYILVDDYLGAYGNPALSFLNWLLPPNVFYMEVRLGEKQVIRAKYSVISLADFLEKTSEKAFHSYFWGRFSQPAAVVYCSERRVKRVLEHALARSVITFLKRTVPCIGPEFTARQLWLTGLGLSYRAEIRPEKTRRLAVYWQMQGLVLEGVTRAALPVLPFEIRLIQKDGQQIYHSAIPERTRRLCSFSWLIRTVQGKILSVLRLLKAAFTFRGGVDYAVWKIKRHSGVDIEVSPFLRRHPVLAMVVLSWKLFSKKAVK